MLQLWIFWNKWSNRKSQQIEKQILKKKQMEIMELENTITKIKKKSKQNKISHWMISKVEMRWQRTELVDLKTDQ